MKKCILIYSNHLIVRNASTKMQKCARTAHDNLNTCNDYIKYSSQF